MSYSLELGAHACHFFTSLDDQKRVTLPFTREGLQLNEYVLLTFPAEKVEDWYVELQASGLDVQQARERGHLSIKAIHPSSSSSTRLLRQGTCGGF